MKLEVGKTYDITWKPTQSATPGTDYEQSAKVKLEGVTEVGGALFTCIPGGAKLGPVPPSWIKKAKEVE